MSFQRKGNKILMIHKSYIFDLRAQCKNIFRICCLSFCYKLSSICQLIPDKYNNALSHKLKKMTNECFLYLWVFLFLLKALLLFIDISFSYYYLKYFIWAQFLPVVKLLMHLQVSYCYIIPLLSLRVELCSLAFSTNSSSFHVCLHIIHQNHHFFLYYMMIFYLVNNYYFDIWIFL